MNNHNMSEFFPWADIDPAITMGGLISHRRTKLRSEWAKVLGGTDDQLAAALSLMSPNVTAANWGITPEALHGFWLVNVKDFEDIASKIIDWPDIRRRMQIFAAGYRSGLESRAKKP